MKIVWVIVVGRDRAASFSRVMKPASQIAHTKVQASGVDSTNRSRLERLWAQCVQEPRLQKAVSAVIQPLSNLLLSGCQVVYCNGRRVLNGIDLNQLVCV